MGSFGKSLSRELGKNTGKVISNIVFGDAWSTPYRRVSTPRPVSESARLRAESARLSYEKKMAEINARTQMEEEQRQIKQMEMQAIREENERRHLLSIDAAVLENVDKIAAIQIPQTEEGILEVLESLTPNMQNAQWKKGREGEIRNQYVDALLVKYTSLVKKLSIINKESPMFSFYYEVLKNANEKMVMNSTPRSLCLSSDEEILALQLSSIVKVIKSNGWTEKKDSTAIQMLDPAGVLFGKCNTDTEMYYNILGEGINTMLDKFPFNKHLCGLIDSKQSLNISRFLGNHKKLLIFYVYILFLSFGTLFWGATKPWSLVVFGLLLGVPLLVLIVSFVKKERLKSSIKSQPQPTSQPQQTSHESKESNEIVAAISKSETSTIVENTSLIDDNLFFDLNIDERIDSRLNNIWKKYANSVTRTLIDRKPIFAADGVRNSILFVGVNPSYSAEDDQLFLHSNSEKTLLYGSFYQRDDAPSYFKSLENFASQCGYAYTQINLLYVRENDRDHLLRQNSEFIREQLELTYETILKISPVAIVFFTDYCKQLIYGANRWVNPATEKNGAFLLTGTQIPVFFSEDVTTLNDVQRENLQHLIKLSL